MAAYRRVYDMRVCRCGPGGRWWQPTTGSMTRVRDQLRPLTLDYEYGKPLPFYRIRVYSYHANFLSPVIIMLLLYKFICGLFAAKGGLINCHHNEHGFIIWIAGQRVDLKTNSTFVWKVGSKPKPMTYTNWSRGEPNNHENVEGCISMSSKYGYTWNDVKCSLEMCFVCQVVRHLA